MQSSLPALLAAYCPLLLPCLRTLDHVGDCLAGEVQQPLDVEVVGSLKREGGGGSSSSRFSRAAAGNTQSCSQR
jgi:hypothetical protein